MSAAYCHSSRFLVPPDPPDPPISAPKPPESRLLDRMAADLAGRWPSAGKGVRRKLLTKYGAALAVLAGVELAEAAGPVCSADTLRPLIPR